MPVLRSISPFLLKSQYQPSGWCYAQWTDSITYINPTKINSYRHVQRLFSQAIQEFIKLTIKIDDGNHRNIVQQKGSLCNRISEIQQAWQGWDACLFVTVASEISKHCSSGENNSHLPVTAFHVPISLPFHLAWCHIAYWLHAQLQRESLQQPRLSHQVQ